MNRLFAGTLALACSAVVTSAKARDTPRAWEKSPWMGAAVGSFFFGQRARVSSSVGPELGLVVGERARLSARLLFPVTQHHDTCRNQDIIYVEPSGVYTCQPSANAWLAATLSAGATVLDGEDWMLSPSVLLARTDAAAHGTFLGLALPVEWVSDNRLRLGAELGFGAALGQEVWGICRNDLGTCAVGSRRRLPNVHTLSGFASLSFSWAFGSAK